MHLFKPKKYANIFNKIFNLLLQLGQAMFDIIYKPSNTLINKNY